MITIIDYGIGNLASIKNMVKKSGFDSVLASDVDTVKNASKIILPGMGSFDHCMLQFNNSGLREIVTRKVNIEKTPVLGICVGLQMLMEHSEEGLQPGVGWIHGQTIKFKKEALGNLKIPNMGWLEIVCKKESRLTQNMKDVRFYFAHSYHVQLSDQSDELMTANYGYDFTVAIERNNILGVQFHPEKSHRFGMQLFRNFGENY